jgi:hypothetical protein
MEKIKMCFGHIRGTCFHCKRDEYNKYCPNYKEVETIVFEVEKRNDTVLLALLQWLIRLRITQKKQLGRLIKWVKKLPRSFRPLRKNRCWFLNH